MSIFNNFPAVGQGGDTSDATATPADILEGKTAYGADGKITGTIPSVEGKQIVPKAAGQIAVAGNVYTTGARIIPKEDNFIPANIRKDVSIWGVVGTLDPGSTPTPDPNLIPANVKAGVTIDGVTGTFTSDATITADYILDGFSGYANGEKITGNIPSKDAATYTPGTADQYINAEQYLSGAQKIAGDANLTAGNIAQGKDIFGVTGTFTSDANATAESMRLGVSAYVNGTRVVGTAPIQEAKTVMPTTTEQTAVASGSFTSGAVKVAGDANLIADNIKQGVSIFGVLGMLEGGGGSSKVTSQLGWKQLSNGETLTVRMDHQPTVIVFYVTNDMMHNVACIASSITKDSTGNFVLTAKGDNAPSIPRPTITSTGFTYNYGQSANCWVQYVAY